MRVLRAIRPTAAVANCFSPSPPTPPTHVDRRPKAGLTHFSTSAFLTILYGNFMIECQDNYHSGTSQLRAAKKMNPSAIERFIIYVREQEHMLKVHQQAGGESTIDLVSYVEFQRALAAAGAEENGGWAHFLGRLVVAPAAATTSRRRRRPPRAVAPAAASNASPPAHCVHPRSS